MKIIIDRYKEGKQWKFHFNINAVRMCICYNIYELQTRGISFWMERKIYDNKGTVNIPFWLVLSTIISGTMTVVTLKSIKRVGELSTKDSFDRNVNKFMKVKVIRRKWYRILIMHIAIFILIQLKKSFIEHVQVVFVSHLEIQQSYMIKIHFSLLPF